jgi:hypothetical protein
MSFFGRVAPTKLPANGTKSGAPAKHGRQTPGSQLKTDLDFSLAVENRADARIDQPTIA